MEVSLLKNDNISISSHIQRLIEKKVNFGTYGYSELIQIEVPFSKKIKAIYLNTSNNYLKTAWATRSLVDSTILMIKNSYKYASNIQKFILLEGKTCPLYSLKIICDTLLKNRKNWLSPLNNSCKESFIKNDKPNLYCSGGSLNTGPSKKCLKKSDCSFWSQWMILDSKYIQDLLDTNISKDKKIVTCTGGSTINQIVVNKKQPDGVKSSPEIIKRSLVEMLDIYNKPCGFSDELYFGLMLKRGRTPEEFTKIINTIKPSKFVIPRVLIKPVSNRSKYIDPEDSSFSSSTMDTNISPVNNYSRSKPGDSEDLPFYLPTILFNDNPITNIYSIPSVYTDWRSFNLNPFNIFRSFLYRNLNINTLLNNNNPENTINILLKSQAHNESFNSLNLNQVAYWAHPLEYNTIPFYSFINGYNILEYFYKNGRDGWLKYLLGLYKNSLLQVQVKNLSTIYIDKYKFITTHGVKNLTRLIGTFITNDILNSARMSGSLFIRKCEKGSNIHKYANQLYKTNTNYLY